MQIVYILSLFAAAICNFIVIGILLRRAEKSPALISFIVLLILINFWAIPQLLINVFSLKNEVFIAVDKISAIGYTLIPVAFFIFALAFTNRLTLLQNYFVAIILFLVPLFFLYFAWNTNLIESRDFSAIVRADWGYPIPTGPMFIYLIIWFESICLLSLIFIIRLYRTTFDTNKKRQALWIIIATLIPLTFGTLTNGLFPAMNIHIFPSAIPLTSIMALIIAYAIFHHELFEPSSNIILSSIGNGMITVDVDGKILHTNQSAIELLEISKAKMVGKSFFDVIILRKKKNDRLSDEDKNPLRAVLQRGKRIESSDFVMSKRRGSQIAVVCTITPIIQKKEIKGATLVFRDITKEKELEASKNQFIGIASHELKTPLTSIKAFSQLLEKKLQKKGDRESKYFIANINKQVDKIMILINDLLDVNRIDEGKYILNKKKTDINALVLRVVNEQQLATAQKIFIKGKFSQEINIDEERIGQVLTNLITNALKYSPAADKVIVILTENKKNITISVQDFGIGIQKSDQKKIFDRFYRTRVSRESNIAGFGLGLSICAENIKRHKGKFFVTSKLHKGSTFSFTLPKLQK